MAINFLNTVAVDENVLFVDTVNDRVGIGTDSPEGNLEISDSTQATGATLSITNAHIGSWVTGDKIGSIDFRIDDTSTTQPVRAKIHAEGKTTGTYPSSSQLVFSTANVNTLYERMRIDSAGNVGIGTTSPSAKLHVNSSDATTVQRIQGATNSALEFYNSSTKTGAILVNSTQFLIAADNSNYLNINTGGSERMRITSGGNVGIGTTSPDAKLDVSDSIPVLRITGTRNANWTIGQTMASLEYFSEDASGSSANSVRASINLVNEASVYGSTTGLSFSTKADVTGSPIEAMRINASGNVGIGTTSPDYLLDVEGSVNNADIAIRINNTFDDNLATSNPTSVLWLNAASNNGYLRVHGAPANTAAKHQIDLGSTAGSSFLTFSPGGAERMRIATDGAIQFNDYGAGTLVTDASGNITVSSGGGAGGPYLPLAGGTMTGATIHNDNVKSIYGTASDGLEIYHDGTDSYINDTGTGSLIIRAADNIKLQTNTADLYFQGIKDGAVKLYYDNAEKLITTNTGVNIAGEIELNDKALLSNQENTDIDSAAAEVVAQVSTTYTAAFFDFVVKKGTNVRSGTVYACHDGTNVEFTETSTNDLGDTSDVTLSVDISGTNMRLLATVTSDDWSVKSLIRAI